MSTVDSKVKALISQVASTVGLPKDWVTQFQNALNAPSAMSAASKTVPGIVRFATDVEASAATIDTVTLTPKQSLAQDRANPLRYGTLVLLFASTVPEGSVAAVDRFQYSSGLLHRESTWHKINGQWTPVGNSLLIEAANDAGARSALASIISDVTANGTVAFIPPWCRAVNVVSGAQYLWNSTVSAWQLTAVKPLIAEGSGTQNIGTGGNVVTVMSATHSDWNDTSKTWTAPEDGIYLCSGFVRWVDNAGSGRNVSVWVNLVSVDSSGYAVWGTPSGTASINRFAQQAVRTLTLTKGQQINLNVYNDSAAVNLIQASLSITKVG